jgi:hypothetical protein
MYKWLDKWLEIGYECHRDKERVPLRSNIAWFIRYKLHY